MLRAAAAVLAILVASQPPRTQGWPFTLAPEDAGSTAAGTIRARRLRSCLVHPAFLRRCGVTALVCRLRGEGRCLHDERRQWRLAHGLGGILVLVAV